MTYRFVAGESVAKGAIRIAREQLGHATASLSPPFDDRATAVHEARKSLKKLRALLRLLRDEIGESCYGEANGKIRDAARALSEIRDAAMLLQALEGLHRENGGRKLASSFDRAREALTGSSGEKGEGDEREVERVMEGVARDLLHMREGVEQWPIARDDFRALKGGLRKVYRQGRRAFAEVVDEPGIENLHEWRKQVKYLWYHVRLLKPMEPEMMAPLAKGLRGLAEALGEDHDLALLESRLKTVAGGDELKGIFTLIEKRRGKLQERALSRGSRIFSEKPKTFVKRLEKYWKGWRTSEAGNE